MEIFLNVPDKHEREKYQVYINDLINPDANARVQAAFELGKGKITEAQPFVEAKLWEKDESSLVMVSALQGLKLMLEDKAYEKIIPDAFVNHWDSQVRFYAAQLLGEKKDKKIRELLEQRYHMETDEKVKNMILFSLVKQDDKKTRSFFLELLQSPEFRQSPHIEHVFEYGINQRVKDFKDVAWQTLSQDSLSMIVRVKAAVYLTLLDDKKARNWLQEHLDDVGWEVLFVIKGKRYRGKKGVKTFLETY